MNYFFSSLRHKFYPFIRLKQFFLNLSLRTKLSSMMLIALAVLSVVAVSGLYRLRIQYEQLLYESYQSLLNYVADSFTQTLDLTADYITTLSTDSTLQDTLADIKDGDHRTAISLIANSRGILQGFLNSSMNPGLFALGVYTDSGTFYNSTYYSDNGYSAELGNKFSDDEIHSLAQEVQSGQQFWTTRYSNCYGLVVAQQVRRISPLRLDNLGVLVGCIDLSSIVEACAKQLQQPSYLFALIDEDDGIFYTSNNLNGISDFSTLYPAGVPYAVLHCEDNSYFAIQGSIDAYGWKFLFAIPYDGVQSALYTQYSYVLIALFACALGVLFLSAFLLHQIFRDLDTLMDMIHKMRHAEFHRISIPTNYPLRQDEIGRLIRQFDSMSVEIDRLIQDNYESRLLAQEAKLQALEMQINPHFLYNTLESVRCCAKLGKQDDVCHIVESLGSMLHFIMSSHNNEIQLRQELGLIDSYLVIQQLRFDEKLQFEAQVGPGCCDAVLPKLTLLPLVENAVLHGVENTVGPVRIFFNVQRCGDQVCVQVKNTGSNFAPNLLHKLRNQEILPTRHGIGLLNVDSRLRYYFNQNYQLTFYQEDAYAVAEVHFPYWTTRKEAAIDAENGDCRRRKADSGSSA
jgi:two-component system sensor histidine kinase YesM